MTVENDVVLIYFEDRPLIFSRVESIAADVKPEWYQVKLLMLQVPLQVVTWILRESYINGKEFTMGGKRIRLEKVICPADEQSDSQEPVTGAMPANVIPLSELRKKS
jgi:hypothetical protein